MMMQPQPMVVQQPQIAMSNEMMAPNGTTTVVVNNSYRRHRHPNHLIH